MFCKCCSHSHVSFYHKKMKTFEHRSRSGKIRVRKDAYEWNVCHVQVDVDLTFVGGVWNLGMVVRKSVLVQNPCAHTHTHTNKSQILWRGRPTGWIKTVSILLCSASWEEKIIVIIIINNNNINNNIRTICSEYRNLSRQTTWTRDTSQNACAKPYFVQRWVESCDRHHRSMLELHDMDTYHDMVCQSSYSFSSNRVSSSCSREITLQTGRFNTWCGILFDEQ